MFSNLLFQRALFRRPIIRRPIYRQPGFAQCGGAGNDIFYNSGGSVGPVGPVGPAGGLIVPVTLVTTTPFTPTQADYLLDINIVGASSVVLPVSPTGKVFIVKDINSLPFPSLITVTAASGALIDGSATANIVTAYGSLTFIFNGTSWDIIA
jgi:hypothetical protein